MQKYLDLDDSSDVIVVGEELSDSQKSPTKDRTTDIKFRTRSGIIRRSMKPVSYSLFFVYNKLTEFVCHLFVLYEVNV